jgi:two-component system, NtrC family, sensor kinase
MAGWTHHEGTSTEDRGQWLPAMLAAASVGMAVVDEQGCWVTVNPTLCRMLGYARTELEGHSFVELTHPDDLPVSQRALERLRRGEMDTFEFEKRYVVRSGEIVWALINGSAFTAPGDEQRLYLVQTHDLTRRKLAEEQLKGERRLLNAFLHHAPYFVCFRDRAGRFLGMSDALAEELGFATADEAIGKTNFDVFTAAQAAVLNEEEQRTMATGRAIVDREEYITRRNGQCLWLSRSVVPLREGRDGAVVGTVTISIDVTTRKLADARLRDSEQRWRSLLAHVEEMVVMIDTSGRIEYASPVVERWLGYPADKLVGLDVTFPAHPDQTAELKRALEDARSGHPVTLIGMVQAADGTWRSVESRIVRLDDSNDASLLLISRDITERLELEQERERLEMDRRVSQRLEAVGQLAAGIAHEINTPLQYVGDSVTFLRDAVDDLLILTGLYREGLFNETPVPQEERRRTMARAEEEADVEYLIDSLPNAFARTEDGIERVRTIVQAMKRFSYASSTEVGPADLNDALRTTLAVCRNEYKYVAEVTTALADIPLVACNIGEINQVFLNLVINAAQAIGEGFDERAEPGHISISTRTDGDDVVVEIKDDGPGIPPEIRERIYEPFFTTKEVGKGTGQGLALARTTIEHHHGSLSCATAVGVGTTFTLRLPIDQATPDADADPDANADDRP